MFSRIACFPALYTSCLLHGLAKSDSAELLGATLAEGTVENEVDALVEQQVEVVEKEYGERSEWGVRSNHRKKVKPVVRGDHFTTQSDFVPSEEDMAKPEDDEGNQEDNELVLIHEERMEQKEAELVDVKYRYNAFPKSIDETDKFRRKTDDKVWEPIRILPWFSLNNLDSQTEEYIKHVMKAGVAYLEKLMTVERVVGKLQLLGRSDCGNDMKIPWKHKNEGVDADIVIYVTAQPKSKWCSGGVYAFGGVCKRGYSKRRPIAGYVNYCKVTSEQRRKKWRSDVEIAVHELSHVLFWLNSHFSRWRDENGKERGIDNVVSCEKRGRSERC